MSKQPEPLDENYFEENQELRERAEKLSEKWEQILADFTLPCPVCKGKMRMQGISPTRLYEFAEGEPGSVTPMDLMPISFICEKCGYLAEFDPQLFNPSYLAELEGAKPQRVEQLRVSDYRVLVPLRGDERSDTMLDLATAIAKSRNGDIVILDASSSPEASEKLDETMQNYTPKAGNPAPTTFIDQTADPLAENLLHAITRYRCRLLLIAAQGWGSTGQAGVAPLIEEIIKDDLCEIGVVHNRGLTQVNRVLLATSGGPNARAAAPLVVDIVRAFDAELHLIYMKKPDGKTSDEEAHTRLEETLGRVNVDGVKLQKRIIEAVDPVQALIQASAEYDLLVLGGSPRDWRSKIRLNSFSATVARNSDTTAVVLVTPGDQPLSFFTRLLGF